MVSSTPPLSTVQNRRVLRTAGDSGPMIHAADCRGRDARSRQAQQGPFWERSEPHLGRGRCEYGRRSAANDILRETVDDDGQIDETSATEPPRNIARGRRALDPHAVALRHPVVGVFRRLLDGGARGDGVPAIRTTKVRAGRLVGVGLAGLSAAQAFSFPGGAQKRP